MNVNSIFLSSLSMSEKFSLSGSMLLRGMGTIFMVLILLWIILSVFGMIFHKEKKQAEKKAALIPTETPAVKLQVPAEKTQAPAVPKTQPAVQDDSALIAAITAAITAYNAAEGKPNLPFRVVSFKRKNNAAGWMGNTADNQ